MKNSNIQLPTLYQQMIHQTRYAKWVESEKRRETWYETVNRYVTHMRKHLSENHNMETDDPIFDEIETAILKLEVMPSMRAMMTSGAALERDNIAGFNCSFIAFDDVRAFDELVYILMCGTGVGFTVERQQITKLPSVPENLYVTDTIINVADSKMGWAKAVKQLVAMLYAGEVPELNTDKVRPAGARLKTFGGRASGPKPLIDLYHFMIQIFKNARGRKLTSIEIHDIACKIGDVVVSGGVRRSALISLSNLDDENLRNAKSMFKVDQYSLISEDDEKWTYCITMKRGQPVNPTYTVSFNKKDDIWAKDQLELEKLIGWWNIEGHRVLSNNSVAYTEKPDVGQWMEEWNSIYQSKSGERGIFNREAALKQCQKFGRIITDIHGNQYEFGVNPCGEIILRPLQFCNLSEVIARTNDTVATLKRKVRLATIIGTYQSSLTNFRYIRSKWKENSEEERLLGVSLTGIMDCPILNGIGTDRDTRNKLLEKLRGITTYQNQLWADKFGINPSAAITCVKPSGTVSLLVDSSPGIHSRWATQYIRTIRNDINDPITQFMIDNGMQAEVDKMKPTNMVFSFPCIAPKGCITRNDRTAIQELENWLDFRTYWCHHNPSVTINVREEEWPTVGAWVWEHFDEVAGISFLPHSDHIYEQAPQQDATMEQIEALQAIIPTEINWLDNIESDDATTGTQELACVSGVCTI